MQNYVTTGVKEMAEMYVTAYLLQFGYKEGPYSGKTLKI